MLRRMLTGRYAKAVSPKQDWRSVTRAFVAATTISDYRWTPPNRRHISSGLYLPSVERSGVGTMVIGVDTSGSVGKEELEQFAAEITAISDEVQPDRIYVVYCDAAVNSVQELHRLNLSALNQRRRRNGFPASL